MKGSFNFLPNFSILCYFKVRTTFIVFGFENFSMLRFKIIFGYYEKWDFVVVIIVRTFVFVRIKFRSMNKDCVSGKKLYKFEGKFIPLQGCMFSYIYIYIYRERERESIKREFCLNF